MYKILHIPSSACSGLLKHKHNVNNLLHCYKYFVIDNGKLLFYTRITYYASITSDFKSIKKHLHEFEVIEIV